MKKIKASSHNFHKVLNQGTGDEVIINYKPTKQDIFDIACWQGWEMNDENRWDNVKSGDFYAVKLEIWGK